MSLTQLFAYAGYGLVFILMISILVAAHEMGHYLFARMFNMGVEEFAIGFGKRPIVTYMRRSYVLPVGPGEDEDAHLRHVEGSVDPGTLANALEGGSPERHIEKIQTANGVALKETTEFTVRPWPLGGFVRIKGMLPEEDGSETTIPGGFYSKAPWQRFLVLLAGPLFSVVAGVLVLIPMFMVDGKKVPLNKPILGAIIKNTAAEKAGLKVGDEITSIDGKPIHTYYDMVGSVRGSGGRTLKFQIQREGKPTVALVTPRLEKEPSRVMGPDLQPTDELVRSYKIGAGPIEDKVRLPFGAATIESGRLPWFALQNVVSIFLKPKEISDNVAGPATMVQATAAAVQVGFWAVVYLAGILSISVGIFNLLPAHPLDGGQMVMAIAEMFRGGKRLSIRAQVIAGGIGMTFVAALILCVFVVDFQRLTKPDPQAQSQSAPAGKR
jgi:regulator of sigma E protease